MFSDSIDNGVAEESEDEDLNEEEMVTILSFFNDCSLQELTSVPTLSAKKAEKIIKMRPFDSWSDLVRNFLLTKCMLDHVSCQRKSREKQGSSLEVMHETNKQSD